MKKSNSNSLSHFDMVVYKIVFENLWADCQQATLFFGVPLPENVVNWYDFYNWVEKRFEQLKDLLKNCKDEQQVEHLKIYLENCEDALPALFYFSKEEKEAKQLKRKADFAFEPIDKSLWQQITNNLVNQRR
jgi:hypothetical protein